MEDFVIGFMKTFYKVKLKNNDKVHEMFVSADSVLSAYLKIEDSFSNKIKVLSIVETNKKQLIKETVK